MRIYTKTGDKGSTSLIGGTKVPKSHLRIESYGTVDELNSFLGLLNDQLAIRPARPNTPVASPLHRYPPLPARDPGPPVHDRRLTRLRPRKRTKIENSRSEGRRSHSPGKSHRPDGRYPAPYEVFPAPGWPYSRLHRSCSTLRLPPRRKVLRPPAGRVIICRTYRYPLSESPQRLSFHVIPLYRPSPQCPRDPLETPHLTHHAQPRNHHPGRRNHPPAPCRALPFIINPSFICSTLSLIVASSSLCVTIRKVCWNCPRRSKNS